MMPEIKITKVYMQDIAMRQASKFANYGDVMHALKSCLYDSKNSVYAQGKEIMVLGGSNEFPVTRFVQEGDQVRIYGCQDIEFGENPPGPRHLLGSVRFPEGVDLEEALEHAKEGVYDIEVGQYEHRTPEEDKAVLARLARHLE